MDHISQYCCASLTTKLMQFGLAVHSVAHRSSEYLHGRMYALRIARARGRRWRGPAAGCGGGGLRTDPMKRAYPAHRVLL